MSFQAEFNMNVIKPLLIFRKRLIRGVLLNIFLQMSKQHSGGSKPSPNKTKVAFSPQKSVSSKFSFNRKHVLELCFSLYRTESCSLVKVSVSLTDVRRKVPGFMKMLKSGQIFQLGERLFKAYKNQMIIWIAENDLKVINASLK